MPKTKKQRKKGKKDTKKRILDAAILYFSKTGYEGTKMSDLAREIGISPGSIYNYFPSKKALFDEIKNAASDADLKQMNDMFHIPMKADRKIRLISRYIVQQLEKDDEFAAMFSLRIQGMLKQDGEAVHSDYESDYYQAMMQLIEQGQEEETVVKGEPLKLADYYWEVVSLYATKILFTKEYLLISGEDLARILLKGNS